MLMVPDLKAIIDQAILHFNGLEVAGVKKVLLTKDQVRALENIVDKDYAIDIMALKKRPDHVLATLEISQLAKLLYGLVEYEIASEQPEYSAGDKVITKKGKEIVTLSNPMINMEAWFLMDNHDKAKWIYTEDFRHATTEEVYWMESLGRKEIADFKKGDVCILPGGIGIKVENERGIHEAKIRYAAGDFKGMFPAESFKPYPEEEAE